VEGTVEAGERGGVSGGGGGGDGDWVCGSGCVNVVLRVGCDDYAVWFPCGQGLVGGGR
jgi:hypothetical protein